MFADALSLFNVTRTQVLAAEFIECVPARNQPSEIQMVSAVKLSRFLNWRNLIIISILDCMRL